MRNIWDMHCHIVPGVDDGAQTPEESMALLREEYKQGVRGIIVTPHFRKEMFETPREIVRENYLLLKQMAAEELPDLSLYLGCEFHANMDVKDYLENPYYRMAGSRYVLLEFSGMHDREYIRARAYEVLSTGRIPIIAHAERYPAVTGSRTLLMELKNMGAMIQINADSVIGKEGWTMKRWCAKAIKADLVDFIGSDGHNIKDRKPHMAEAVKRITRKYGEDYAEMIFCENPRRVAANM